MARFIEMAAFETEKRIARIERQPNEGEAGFPVEIARVECTDDDLFTIIGDKVQSWDASHISLPPNHPQS